MRILPKASFVHVVVPVVVPVGVLAGILAGCPNPDNPNADAGIDAGIEPETDAGIDAGEPEIDAGTDAGEPEPDAGEPDAGIDAGEPDAGIPAFPIAGFGTISGCPDVAPLLASSEPSFSENAIDFGADPYDDADLPRLTEGGQEIIADGNAGGSSVLSEVIAFEVLARCAGAELVKTETEIEYTVAETKITDILVRIDGTRYGVSVARAVSFPFDQPYPQAEADRVLRKKLGDILISSANVAPADNWPKQILHVIAYAPEHVPVLRAAWEAIEPAVKADTVVYITTSNGDDDFIY